MFTIEINISDNDDDDGIQYNKHVGTKNCNRKEEISNENKDEREREHVEQQEQQGIFARQQEQQCCKQTLCSTWSIATRVSRTRSYSYTVARTITLWTTSCSTWSTSKSKEQKIADNTLRHKQQVKQAATLNQERS